MFTLRRLARLAALLALLGTTLSLSGCTGNVGIGMSVGVPIGNHGYISMGSGRYWY